MALTVNTNLASMGALNNLNRTQHRLGGTFERISSGLRVNRAADDAAGLAVAENLDSSIRSLAAAKRNSNDGLSVIQVAEGATQEVANMLKRMRELAVQSSSDTLDTAERAYIQDEVNALLLEVDRIATVTNFNGVPLSDGTTATLDVQVGIDDTVNDRITVSLGDLGATTLAINALDVDDSTNARASITVLDAAMDTVNQYRSTFGAIQNRLESAIRNTETYEENLSGAKSRILDADFAKEAADLSKMQIMQQAGVAILGQANQINSGAVRLLG